MIRGLYAAASGMMAQIARQDTYANNLANASSVGYRRCRAAMGQFQADLAAVSRGGNSLRAAGGVSAVPAGLDLTQGTLQTTSRPLDLALSGDGFFVIQTARGVAYTRDGQFQLNSQNQLVDGQGRLVLGESGPLTLNSPDFTVSSTGDVTCAGLNAGKLRLVALQNPRALGGSLYGGREIPSTGCTVTQGMLEQSNVTAVREMGRMMNGYRLYEANASALRYQDETLSSLMKIVQ